MTGTAGGVQPMSDKSGSTELCLENEETSLCDGRSEFVDEELDEELLELSAGTASSRPNGHESDQ